jgi:hypothetical protein
LRQHALEILTGVIAGGDNLDVVTRRSLNRAAPGYVDDFNLFSAPKPHLVILNLDNRPAVDDIANPIELLLFCSRIFEYSLGDGRIALNGADERVRAGFGRAAD